MANELTRNSEVPREFWTVPRLMKLVVLVAFLSMVAVTANFIQQTNIQAEQRAIVRDRAIGRENGYKNRAVACETLIVDNDRFFKLDFTCVDPEIYKYYPPLICEGLGYPLGCGSNFVESTLLDPVLQSEPDE